MNRIWALAAVARCRGMLAGPGQEFESEFLRALELHSRTPTPFETARTELRFGQCLRRAKRIADARTHLHTALATFDQLGAQPWANQVRGELAASGEKQQVHTAAALHQLTAQELQIALMVSRGARNREVSASLFLSEKTIEFHLSKVYRKLEVRSRTELANVVAQQASGEAVPGDLMETSPVSR